MKLFCPFRYQLLVGPQVTHNCCLIQLQVKGFYDFPFLGFDNLLVQLTELRETLIFVSLLKNTDEQPDEEICRVSLKNGTKHRSFWSHGAGICHPPGMWMFSPTWKLSEPHPSGHL